MQGRELIVEDAGCGDSGLRGTASDRWRAQRRPDAIHLFTGGARRLHRYVRFAVHKSDGEEDCGFHIFTLQFRSDTNRAMSVSVN
jgi:hypothetical protein